ncbi:hypothetical protein [Dyadobacter sp. LHD-138]|uniref:hypothetical protein n=1 Tax=Dyadobacter sp. LHD-138 TaxID=3071413 RepID=UPI0027DFF021|nr:hypothetical protein [Dyadobacter sp. LHD-138]MDQ6481610.1 hypothetical protein [Dyadobacter sp. LHD-138]
MSLTETLIIGQSELAEILLNSGLVETTKISDYKREFKKSKSSNKSVYFNHSNTRVGTLSAHDEKITLTICDVKSILFFINTSKADFSKIVYGGNFQYDSVVMGIESARKKINSYENFPKMKSQRDNLIRIVAVYDGCFKVEI